MPPAVATPLHRPTSIRAVLQAAKPFLPRSSSSCLILFGLSLNCRPIRVVLPPVLGEHRHRGLVRRFIAKHWRSTLLFVGYPHPGAGASARTATKKCAPPRRRSPAHRSGGRAIARNGVTPLRICGSAASPSYFTPVLLSL